MNEAKPLKLSGLSLLGLIIILKSPLLPDPPETRADQNDASEPSVMEKPSL